MSARLARTADGWWAVTPAGLVRLGLAAATTAGLLADRAVLQAAIDAAQATAATAPRDAVPADSVDLLSPVTAPARVVAQAVNYRSHATDSGFDPDAVPPAFFRKASHSITGPAGDIIRPDGVGFLDYEVELGLVIGADLPVGTTVTEADLARYVAALVVANDVSARQVQLVKTQFYESKSYPTFTPVGPWLTLVDAADLARLGSLRLTLSVNGEVRQDSTAADMIVRPAQALTLLSRFQPMAPGDLLLTGTPGGTALKAPAKIAGMARRAAAARHPVEAVLRPAGGQPPLPARRRRHHRDDRLPRRAARPRHPAHHRHREDAMTTPRNTAAAGLDLPAAAGRRPRLAGRHRHPVDPGPGRLHPLPGLDLRRAGGHGDADRQRADRPGGAARDAVTLSSVNTSMLYAATLAAQAAGIAAPVNPALSGERIAELIRRTGSRVLVAAGPELDPQLWQRLLEVARQAGMTAVLALRPDGAHGDPPALDLAGDAPAGRRPRRPRAVRGLPGRRDRRAAVRPPGRRGPAAGRRSRGVRAYRGDHRRPEGRRAHPRQPARLRPGDRPVQRAGSRGGDAGRAAAVPRQRPDRHRHRPDVQRRPGGVAGPGRLPRQGPVRPVLDRSSSTTGSRRCPPSPPSTAPWPRSRSTPTSARCGCRSQARPRCRPRCARTSPRTPGGACWRATGSPRPPAPAPGPGRARNAPGRSAASCPGSRSRPSRSAPTGPGPTAAPARPGCW